MLRKVLYPAFVLLILACPSAAEDRGPLVSMTLRDAELKDVLMDIGQEHGLNMIIDERVSGTVTVSLRDVSLWDALDSMLESRGYAYRRIGGSLIVVEPASDAQKEEHGIAVREFRLKNSNPSEDIMDTVKGVLSRKGTVSYVPHAKAIVVKDIALGIKRVEALLEHIDVEPVQVMIEAKIAELTDSFQRELGIQWGARYTSKRVFGRLGDLDSGFAVNLPSTEQQGGTFDLGLIVDKYSVDFQLSALEDTGEAKIVSSPRIMVLDNEEAVITSGAEILVPSVSTADVLLPLQGTEGKASDVILTQKPGTFDAKLALTVRPRVIDEQHVSMTIHTKREEFDFETLVNDFPVKRSRTAKTDLTVRSGDTIVIGGIYTKAETRDERAVPLISRVPLLGWLFKKKARSSGQAELLIFLTPTIVKKEGP